MKITSRIRMFTAGIIIVLAVIFFGGVTALAEGGFAEGTGTLEDPWLIETPEQLASVAEEVYYDKHFKLIADIDLSDYLSEGGGGWNEGAGWAPIGTWNGVLDPGSPFTGSFDGDGHTISNLYVNRNETDGVGLFGFTDGAAIKDVRLENADITGYNYVGSLVGYNKGCTIDGSSADFIEILGESVIGGLVGYNRDGAIINSNAAGNVTGTFSSVGGLAGSNDLGEITNSYSAAAVQGDYAVGGLAGQNSYGSIESSYATGTVSDIAVPDPESEGYFGGLVGRNHYEGEITNCYATGNVDGTQYVGGLVGENKKGGIITSSFATGDVTGTDYVGGLVGYNFFDDPIYYNAPVISDCYATGSVDGTQCIGGLVGENSLGIITQSYAAGAVTGTDYVGGLVGSSDSSIISSYYDSETTGWETGDGESKTTIQMQTPVTYIDWDFAAVWGINPEQNGGYPFFRWQTEYTDAQFAGGTGDAETPYLVATPWQLNNARLYLDKHFILVGDIDISDYLSEGSGGWNDGAGWQPIGKFLFAGSPDNVPFTGSFDGNGFTISNLMINRTDKGCNGLFSCTGEDAKIFDLRLAAVEVTGSYSVGGLVGENKGEISNCSIEGSITGNDEVGGLVGWQWDTGTISDSYATGNVTGSSDMAVEEIGGLVGNNGGSITNSYAMVTVNVDGYYNYVNVGGLAGCNNGDINNSYATGDVTALYATDDGSAGDAIGGLVGFNSSSGSGAAITNSYATGEVTGEDKAGGLVGENQGHITNSYATGEVIGEGNLGGLVGYKTGGTVTASYYDSDTTGQSDTGKGIPETTEDMQLRSTYINWNFLSIWGIEDNEGCPALRWQDGAPQSGFGVTAASPVYMGIEFQLDISNAKGADGNSLNGDVLVSVYSETQDEDVAESSISFSGGEAAVPVTLDTSGAHELRVYVDGVSYSNLLTIELLAVQGIEVTSPPEKTTYFVGEELDLTGLVVTGTYSDDFTGVLPITTANISDFDSSAPAEGQVVTVTYGGKTATFTVEIEQATLESIAITTSPAKLTYTVGDALDITGMVVTGTYSDNSTEELTITLDNISGFDSSAAAADQSVTVTYEGKTATFTVDIVIEQVTYTVTYNANGGTGTAPTENDKAEGDSFFAAANSFTAPGGKQFKEWNTDASGTGTGYLAGATITMPAGNLTLYAIWEDITNVPSDNANLSGLALSAGTLSPDFNQAVTGYSASVGSSVASIEVTPTTADSKATVTVNGSGVASGSAGSVSLNIGTNAITIAVTAENGTTSKTYTITVNRASSGSGGGGGGGGTQLPAPVTAVDSRGNITTVPKLDKNTGVAAAEIDSNTLATAFARAAKDSEGKKTVKIEMSTVKDTLAYEFILPASALTSPDVNKQLEIRTEIAAVTLPANMLTQETAAGAENISLTIAQADVSGLDEETRNQIGDRPVIQLGLKLDGEPYPWSNESAPVTVSIPYQPTADELADPEHITVWYIDGAGNVVEVPSGRYDPATGAVTFSTTHFSSFAVVCVTKTFDDLESVAWAKKPIEVLASKGILKGVAEKEYAPQTNITRADFLYFLVRTLGVDAKVEGNFDDLSRDAYYYKEIGTAKKLGITSGTGNNKFSPDASITRQDMMVLTENALRMLKKLEGQGTASDLDRFTDKSLIAAYAVNGVASVVKEGLIVGSGDRINPLGNTTRAEAAVFLHRIYNK